MNIRNEKVNLLCKNITDDKKIIKKSVASLCHWVRVSQPIHVQKIDFFNKGAKTIEQRTVLSANDTGTVGYLYANNWNLA